MKPDTAAFVDAIRAGMRGETTFWAAEAGRTVGTPGTVPADGRLHVFSDEEFDDMRARS